MIKLVNIRNVQPAAYNPRRISNEQFEKLKESLSTIGFTVPILVNSKNNVIIAGHQRTKAATAIGITEVPAVMVSNVSVGDEIKFNQLHNGVDAQRGFECLVNTNGLKRSEFIDIDISRFAIKKTGATYVKEICKILLKYGNVLSCVICNGEVLIGTNYIRACELLGMTPHCYIIVDALFHQAFDYMKADYGEYSYDGVQKNTYVQGLAQMHRNLTKEDIKKRNKSNLYENYVMPYIAQNKVESILDFGCGKGTYINHLAKSYKNAVGVEFFNNNGKQINVTMGNLQIDKLIEHLKKSSTFDVVVCDSVLNSVDSVQAEKSVMACLNLFCEKRLFISGRPLKAILDKLGCQKDKSTIKYVTYLDSNNFTGDYRKGNWYFQHFHDKDDIKRLLEESGFKIVRMTYMTYGDSWQVEAIKVRNLSRQEYIDALNFEFNLPLPGGKSYCRHDDVKRVLGLIENENKNGVDRFGSRKFAKHAGDSKNFWCVNKTD